MPAGSTNAAYHERLKQIREAGQTTTLLPPEERASRCAMRKAGGQPRILLTNVKQLELLLTRGKDVGIFAGRPSSSWSSTRPTPSAEPRAPRPPA
jgi:hypothetical protein